MHPDYMHIGEVDDKLIEEMAELTKELCKVKRFGMSDKNRTNIILEISDVEYRLKEYKELMGIS